MTTTTQALDTDRQRVVAALECHPAAGRLAISEFAGRAGVAYRAQAFRAEAFEELAAPLADLPPPAARQAVRVPESQG